MSGLAECACAGEDYGGVGKDLDKDLGVLATQSGTLVPDGAADRFAHSAGPGSGMIAMLSVIRFKGEDAGWTEKSYK